MIKIEDKRVSELAGKYFGNNLKLVNPVNGGRNSRVYKINSANRNFKLKFFRSNSENDKSRIMREKFALDLFKKFQINNVPSVFEVDIKNNLMITDWIVGDKIKIIQKSAIDAMIDFLSKLHKVYLENCEDKYPKAIDACIIGSSINKQIKDRLTNFSNSFDLYPELDDFINNTLMPLYDEIKQWSGDFSKSNNINLEKPLAIKEITLSPVDFGIHNMLSYKSNYNFIDFEFFGLDDPAKLVSDTLLHPGFTLNEDHFIYLKAELLKLYLRNKHFGIRLKALMPLFGIKWCLIMLNPFLNNYISSDDNHDDLRKEQLDKTRIKLQFIKKTYKEF